MRGCGVQPLMEASPPNLVMVEAYPSRMRRGGGGSLPALLKRMTAWGYTDISHAGAHCDERWATLTKKTRCPFPPLPPALPRPAPPRPSPHDSIAAKDACSSSPRHLEPVPGHLSMCWHAIERLQIW